jgi:transcriptional regulator with XRE-family HTH domain
MKLQKGGTKMHKGLIKELVRERCRERGLSFSKLAIEIGVNPNYLLFVLHGRNTSRPLVRKVAEHLGYSELPAIYEEYLEYLKERRRKLRELARMLDEQTEGEVWSPSVGLTRGWKNGTKGPDS